MSKIDTFNNDDLRWLIARELPYLRRFARILVHDRLHADDLVADCLSRAIVSRGDWGHHGGVRTWLYHLLYSSLRTASKRTTHSEDTSAGRRGKAEILPLPGPESGIRSTRDRAIADAVARLPREQRAAILLTVVEGMPYEQVATVLRMPLAVMRSCLAQGRERLYAISGVPSGQARLWRVK